MEGKEQRWVTEEQELTVEKGDFFDIELGDLSCIFLFPKKGEGSVENIGNNKEIFECELKGKEPCNHLRITREFGETFRITPKTEVFGAKILEVRKL